MGGRGRESRGREGREGRREEEGMKERGGGRVAPWLLRGWSPLKVIYVYEEPKHVHILALYTSNCTSVLYNR